ncbi:hypothetical protein BS643_12755 [Pseudomonas protegens]|uniref:S24 family peptidase n=1 Tax=Pseudomonas protegens TaxID=380021 RepID=UPI00080714B0|nr:S24 family peptidase [Pseudomonas protegens]OBZ25462.1 hypothetical protein BBH58_08270 [Pseudomonas protegens]OBZ31425.1 hypothetical protein BBH57_16470 [Pseudomonas protegens]OKK42779.1 hypothetical protein BS644_19645 [Pseudomonas protegens]OKK46408.1 hypothetical protein BS643_12755 [Pseudomonas protegens]OKK61404.1 hypothetical protein BS645_08180 [Pseudomonas protegens]
MTETTPSPSALALTFKARREELQLTQEDVARLVSELLKPPAKLTQQTYAAFERGKSQTSKHAWLIAQVLGIREALDSTLSNQSEPLTAGPKANARLIADPVLVWDEETSLYDEVEVPLFKEVELADGSGHCAIKEQGKVKLRIGAPTLQQMGIDPANIICAEVSGNSMSPVIPDGSTVGVDRGRTSVKDGDIFAINHNDQLRIRMLYRLPLGGLRMRSFNRDEHPDEEYTADRIRTENIEVLGRVFWYSVLR